MNRPMNWSSASRSDLWPATCSDSVSPPGQGLWDAPYKRARRSSRMMASVPSSRFEGPDKQTGFVSRSLLAVPMQVKDRVLGVIEVINRRDGLPFVEDDQNLLTAFAGQAAVAIENARLLALTDQELADRVEELQVMERIDRELNASLEVDRAMRITLEWAMRQSNAEAGLDRHAGRGQSAPDGAAGL